MRLFVFWFGSFTPTPALQNHTLSRPYSSQQSIIRSRCRRTVPKQPRPTVVEEEDDAAPDIIHDPGAGDSSDLDSHRDLRGMNPTEFFRLRDQWSDIASDDRRSYDSSSIDDQRRIEESSHRKTATTRSSARASATTKSSSGYHLIRCPMTWPRTIKQSWNSHGDTPVSLKMSGPTPFASWRIATPCGRQVL